MIDFLSPLISAAAGLSVVFLGGWLTNRREREKRRTGHIERQLSELYGPLVTIRKQLDLKPYDRLGGPRASRRPRVFRYRYGPPAALSVEPDICPLSRGRL